MKPQVFVFIGSSGSGKGTQAKLLKEYLEKKDSRTVLYMETGQAFRDFVEQKKSYTADLLGKAMKTGELVPVFIPVWAWTNFLVESYTGEEHVIFDGLARREIEAPILDSAMKFYGIEHVQVVYIKTSDGWSTERLLGRGRRDDHEKEIKRRLSWFHKNTMRSIEYFREHEHASFHEINGEQTIEEVHKDVLSSLKFV